MKFEYCFFVEILYFCQEYKNKSLCEDLVHKIILRFAIRFSVQNIDTTSEQNQKWMSCKMCPIGCVFFIVFDRSVNIPEWRMSKIHPFLFG